MKLTTPFWSRFGEWAILVGFLGGMVWMLHGSVLHQWWMFDDPQILKQALEWTPFDYFLVPAVWRTLVIFSFTPWLTLVYDLDLSLFGFVPKAFYAHTLLTLTLCAVLIYHLLRRGSSRAGSLLGAMLFLVGTPTAAAVQQLMARHYLEGLLLFLLGLHCYLRALSKASWGWALLSGLLMTLACTAKEIYVPLALVPLMLPVATFRKRLLWALPIVAGLLIYVPWRHAMLGTFVGGYTPAGEMVLTADLPKVVARFLSIPELLWKTPLLSSLAVVVLMLLGILTSRHPRSMGIFLLGLLGLMVIPLLPLGFAGDFAQDSDRFFLAPWVLLSLGVPWSFSRISGKRWVRGGLMLICVFLIGVPSMLKTQGVMAERQAIYRMYAEEGQRYLDLSPADYLLASPTLLAHYFMGLRDLRRAINGSAAGGTFVMDESSLMGREHASGLLFRYDAVRGQVIDATAEWPSLMAHWRQSLREDPLRVEVDYRPAQQTLKWIMGPYRGGSYHLVAEGVLVPIPDHGSIRRESPLPARFRIRYEDAAGWRIYSKPLSLEAITPEHLHLEWEGAGDLFADLVSPDPLMSSQHHPYP